MLMFSYIKGRLWATIFKSADTANFMVLPAKPNIIFEEKTEIQDQYPLNLNPAQKADDPESGS